MVIFDSFIIFLIYYLQIFRGIRNKDREREGNKLIIYKNVQLFLYYKNSKFNNSFKNAFRCFFVDVFGKMIRSCWLNSYQTLVMISDDVPSGGGGGGGIVS